MKKIVILVPYFGEWPPWFGLFLKTCRYNPTIDWVFFTDCDPPSGVPNNVYFRSMTLKSFSCQATQKIGLPIEIKRPYKICDLRPAFADIFEDEVEEYDFWGWGDTDVLYGNLRDFFTPKRLKKYDVLGLRRYRTSGMLTLLRNSKIVNKLYKRSSDYKKVLTEDRGYAFDEFGRFNNRTVESITHVVKKERKKGNIKALFWEPVRTDEKIGKNFEYYWVNGNMYDLEYGSKFALYHFLDRKNNPQFEFPKKINTKSGFYISDSGIEEAKKPRKVSINIFPLVKKYILDKIRRAKHKIEGIV